MAAGAAVGAAALDWWASQAQPVVRLKRARNVCCVAKLGRLGAGGALTARTVSWLVSKTRPPAVWARKRTVWPLWPTLGSKAIGSAARLRIVTARRGW